MEILVGLGLILGLVLCGIVISLSEISFAAARDTRLRAMASGGASRLVARTSADEGAETPAPVSAATRSARAWARAVAASSSSTSAASRSAAGTAPAR